MIKLLDGLASARRLRARCALMAAALSAGGYAGLASAATCESLASLHLPSTTITAAQSIAAGSYQPPGSPTVFTNLPAFCRVTATLRPAPNSSIKIEVWLPTETWNGRYQQVGNHGFTGTIWWSEMAPQLQRGYATGATDDGHTVVSGFDVAWAINRPERITDLAWRAVHLLADRSKLILKAFYERPQNYAYFHGCSDGGREGMKEAQMFPGDFDGIIIGGTAANWTRSSDQLLSYSKTLIGAGIQGTEGAAILRLVQKGATAACDAQDGVIDGSIRNPSSCHWDPTTLICKAGQEAGTCLTPAQAAAVQTYQASLRDPVTGEVLFANMQPGAELEQIKRGRNVGLEPFSVGNFKIAFNDYSYDGTTFDLHRDFPILDRALADVNATDPDLAPFKGRGAKMIQWHGWDDSSFIAGWTVDYYDRVVQKTGNGNLASVQDFYRLFMLPSVGHCGGGIGPDNIGAENQTAVSSDPEHDIVSALEAWVEHGVAPQKLIATKFNNDAPSQGIALQRPVCPYPDEAIYDGTGDTNAASSFRCGRP